VSMPSKSAASKTVPGRKPRQVSPSSLVSGSRPFALIGHQIQIAPRPLATGRPSVCQVW